MCSQKASSPCVVKRLSSPCVVKRLSSPCAVKRLSSSSQQALLPMRRVLQPMCNQKVFQPMTAAGRPLFFLHRVSPEACWPSTSNPIRSPSANESLANCRAFQAFAFPRSHPSSNFFFKCSAHFLLSCGPFLLFTWSNCFPPIVAL